MKTKAFTMLELLVAMTVFSLLVIMLMGVVDSASTLWRNSEKQVETLREARIVLHMLSGEMASIVVATNANYSSNFFLLDPASPNAKMNSKLGFVSALSLASQEASSKSDLCAIAYFVAEGKLSPFTTNKTWNLYRYFLDSTATAFKITNSSPPNLFSSSDLTPDNTKNVEIVAKNVRAFRIKPFYQWDDGTWKPWTKPTTPPTVAGTKETDKPGPIPQLLEIEIDIVDSETAKKQNGKIGLSDDINPHSIRTNSTRVAVDPFGGTYPWLPQPTPTPAP